MEDNTGKRLGRPRKVLRLPEGIAEGESASCIDNGDGETSGTGSGAQAVVARSFQTWLEFVNVVVHAQKHYKNRLRTVWHPEPLHDLIHTDGANVRVEKGSVKAQLNTAQFVDL